MTSDLEILLITFVGTGLILIGIAIPLIYRKIKINNWYGIRLPQTMKDENTWYEVNKICAKHLLYFGAAITILSPIILLSNLFTLITSTIILTILITVGTILIVIFAFRTTNKIYKKNNPN